MYFNHDSRQKKGSYYSLSTLRLMGWKGCWCLACRGILLHPSWPFCNICVLVCVTGCRCGIKKNPFRSSGMNVWFISAWEKLERNTERIEGWQVNGDVSLNLTRFHRTGKKKKTSAAPEAFTATRLEQHWGRQKKKNNQDGVGEHEVVTFHGELSSVGKDGRAEQRRAINYHSLTGEMRLWVSKTQGQFSQGQFSLY